MKIAWQSFTKRILRTRCCTSPSSKSSHADSARETDCSLTARVRSGGPGWCETQLVKPPYRRNSLAAFSQYYVGIIALRANE